ncbi:agamous-like MADS-box AGL27 [Olea europaea subsp. europaea]|uniref:Agamous-like MADS-box AGL27 n=2 Tax=Olea europaea TaxID=4146 RepID=A0A8S0QW01_OLEEU|nr:agamous-like MADS-box AGL27 [Olea europaea subsp. europaea]
MGRRKLEIKRIENKSSRQVTFTKRRNGLIKKAKELAVLCEVDVNVIIFSSRGKLYRFCSSNSLAEILRRYHSHVEAEPSASAGVCETQEYTSNYASFLSSEELLQIVERDLREPYVDNISINDLVHLEEQLQAALITARSTKVNFLKQFNFLFRIHYLQKEQPQAVLFRTRSKDVEFFYFLSTRSEKDEEIFSTVIVTSSENTNFE